MPDLQKIANEIGKLRKSEFRRSNEFNMKMLGGLPRLKHTISCYHRSFLRQLNLRNVKGESMEYLPLTRLFATQLKIQLIGSKTIHCLRMEVYGCESTSNEEYNG